MEFWCSLLFTVAISLLLTTSSRAANKDKSLECNDRMITQCQCGENGTIQDVYVTGCLMNASNNSHVCQPCSNSCDLFSYCKACSKQHCLTCPTGRTGKFCENLEQIVVNSSSKLYKQRIENDPEDTTRSLLQNKLLFLSDPSETQKEVTFVSDKYKYNYIPGNSNFTNISDLIENIYPVDNRTAFDYSSKKINYSFNESAKSIYSTLPTIKLENLTLGISLINTDALQLPQNNLYGRYEKKFERFFDLFKSSNKSSWHKKHISGLSGSENNTSWTITESEASKETNQNSSTKNPKVFLNKLEKPIELKVPQTLPDKQSNLSKNLENKYTLLNPLNTSLFKIAFIVVDDNKPSKKVNFTQETLIEYGKEKEMKNKTITYRGESVNKVEKKNMSSGNDNYSNWQKFVMNLINLITQTENKYSDEEPFKTNYLIDLTSTEKVADHYGNEQLHRFNDINKKLNAKFLSKLIKDFLTFIDTEESATNPVETFRSQFNSPVSYIKKHESLKNDGNNAKFRSGEQSGELDSTNSEVATHHGQTELQHHSNNLYMIPFEEFVHKINIVLDLLIGNPTEMDHLEEREENSEMSEENLDDILQDTNDNYDQCTSSSEFCAQETLEKKLFQTNPTFYEPSLTPDNIRNKIINPHLKEIGTGRKTESKEINFSKKLLKFLTNPHVNISKYNKPIDQNSRQKQDLPLIHRHGENITEDGEHASASLLLESKENITSRSKRALSDEAWCPVSNKMLNADLDCTIWSYQKFCILECHPGFTNENKYFRCSREQDTWNPELIPCLPTGKHNVAYGKQGNNVDEIVEKDSGTETGQDNNWDTDENDKGVENERVMGFEYSEETGEENKSKRSYGNKNQHRREIENKSEDFRINGNTTENEKKESYGKIDSNEYRKKTENRNDSFVQFDTTKEKIAKSTQIKKEDYEIKKKSKKGRDGFPKFENGKKEKGKDFNRMNSDQYRKKLEDESGSFVTIINTEAKENNHKELNDAKSQNEKKLEEENVSEIVSMEITSLRPAVSFHSLKNNHKKRNRLQERKGNFEKSFHF
ncbi:uncharacterized protein NPIL_350101 [Nephila pilipes]|uniref:Sushi domain-containing protein n=1 Tax=Nephila pilipes TaxID=299642 RepID=A0A8X6UMV1_NEPPI|nr:uncharacterized protein NPIL_350101 [Nephila pilipes]